MIDSIEFGNMIMYRILRGEVQEQHTYLEKALQPNGDQDLSPHDDNQLLRCRIICGCTGTCFMDQAPPYAMTILLEW